MLTKKIIRKIFRRKKPKKKHLDAEAKLIKKQRKWLRKKFDIDESEFPPEQLQAVTDYWDDITDGKYSVDPIYCQFYSQSTGIFDPRYIPDDFQYWILEKLNIHRNNISAFTDKNYLEYLMAGVKMPEAILHCVDGSYLDPQYRLISKEQALELLKAARSEGFIQKPAVASYGGAGIMFGSAETSDAELEAFLSDSKNDNFIVQKLIQQHPDMAVFNKESVNSIRVLSIILNEKVLVVSSVVRMGVDNARVDNFSAGGVCCGIDQNGCLREYCYSSEAEKLDAHPSGLKLQGRKIPSYDSVCEIVKHLHARFPQFGVISWDFAIDEEGDPVLIEYNVGRGGVHIHQLCNGPLYGDLTEEVVRSCFDGLDKPVIIVAELNSSGKPYLEWHPVANAAEYEIYRATNNGDMIKMFSTDKTRYINMTFENNTSYSYMIKAIPEKDIKAMPTFSAVVTIEIEPDAEE